MIKPGQIKKLESKIMAVEKLKGSPFCPQCGSVDVTVDGALVKFNSNAMVCKRCGNKDIAFPEVLIKGKNKK